MKDTQTSSVVLGYVERIPICRRREVNGFLHLRNSDNIQCWHGNWRERPNRIVTTLRKDVEEWGWVYFLAHRKFSVNIVMMRTMIRKLPREADGWLLPGNITEDQRTSVNPSPQRFSKVLMSKLLFFRNKNLEIVSPFRCFLCTQVIKLALVKGQSEYLHLC